MALTGTLATKNAGSPAGASAVRSARAAAPAEETQAPGGLVFNLLLLFTFILLARPQDLIEKLQPIPIAQIVGFAAIGLYVVQAFTGKIRWRFTIELKLMLGMTVWFSLGVPFSIWRSNSLNILTDNWLKTSIIFLLLTQTMTNLSRVRKLLWVIFLSGLCATGLSLALGNPVAEEERFMGVTRGFFSGNYLGIAAAVTLPYMAAMLVHARSFLRVALLLSSFGTMIFMVVLTASRGNIVSIIISLILVWAMVLRNSLRARLIGALFAIGLVAAITFAPGIFWNRVKTLWESESYATSNLRVAQSAEGSEYQRKALLQRSIRYTFENPLFGVGLGNFEIASGAETGDAQEWKGTHNTFTQVSSEAGIPAFLLFVGLLFAVIGKMRRVSQITAGKPELAQIHSLADATMVSIYAFTIGGFFAHLAYAYYVYYLAAIGVGLQWSCGLGSPQNGESPANENGRKIGNGKSNGGLQYRNGARESQA